MSQMLPVSDRKMEENYIRQIHRDGKPSANPRVGGEAKIPDQPFGNQVDLYASDRITGTGDGPQRTQERSNTY